MSSRIGSRFFSFGRAVIAGVFAVLFIGPIVWMIIGSVATPTGATLANYNRVATYSAGLGTYLANSATVALVTVVVSLATSLLAGYAFSRLRVPGGNFMFFGILAILMVPHTSLLIPLYVWLGNLGLGNTLVGLGLVIAMYQMPFSVFMMRNSFDSVPRELDEAGLVDGCTPFSVLWRVLLPAVAPGLITVALFAFLAAWNEFVSALILLTDGSSYTLPLALVNLATGDWGAVDFGALQAGVTVSAVPCLILFFFLQRFFVSGAMNGAVKG